MNQTDQKSRIYYQDQFNSESRVSHLEEAIIKSAYFGRYPMPASFAEGGPIGLNVYLEYGLTVAGATYTNIEDIESLMDDLRVSRVEELVGKKVITHLDGMLLIGLSVPEEQS